MIPNTHKLAIDWLNDEDIDAYSDGKSVYIRIHSGWDLEISEKEILYRSTLAKTNPQ